jgi:hypothetical protein
MKSFFLSTEYYAKDQAEIARGNLRKVWKTHPFCQPQLVTAMPGFMEAGKIGSDILNDALAKM